MLLVRFWDAGTGLSDAVVRFVSRRIEGDGTDAVHVSIEAIWFDDETGGWAWEGVEAVPTGVRRYDPTTRVPFDTTRVYALLPTGHRADAHPPDGGLRTGVSTDASGGATLGVDPLRAWSYADAKVGVPYDFAGLLVALACACSHRPRRTFFDTHHASLFCSELATNALRDGGYDPFRDHRRADNATPAALEGALVARGWTRMPTLEFRTRQTEKSAA